VRAFPALAVLCCLALVPACGKPSYQAPAPAGGTQPTGSATPAREAPPPKLTSAQEAQLDAAFREARGLVEQARELKRKGEEVERTANRQAANDYFRDAKRLYRDAAAVTEDWIEPGLGKVTERQVEWYLAKYVRERGAWFSESASMGKIHD